ncbi:hypothetical protein EG832_04995 [bacterium]|nr:hypothetical protein [bacterium]
MQHWKKMSELGVGEILDLMVCNNCGHEVEVGKYNRTDGEGGYTENEEWQNECRLHELNCMG